LQCRCRAARRSCPTCRCYAPDLSPLNVPHAAVDGPTGRRRLSKFAAERSKGGLETPLTTQQVAVDSLPGAAKQPACGGGR
jgi:hypothetical protein